MKKKEFVVFALQHKVTENRFIDLAYDIKFKLKELRKIINDRTKADRFPNLFWSEVYDFNDLIVVILFRSSSKEEVKRTSRFTRR